MPEINEIDREARRVAEKRAVRLLGKKTFTLYPALEIEIRAAWLDGFAFCLKRDRELVDKALGKR